MTQDVILPELISLIYLIEQDDIQINLCDNQGPIKRLDQDQMAAFRDYEKQERENL
ncbi:hypothetical protein OZY43_07055 [Lactobacillus sp. ESL0785]|uniref:hypothetical protein n=1 Tax=Lactobacillus sp. ESL0785 TaxID=2983232 RepID=UPI0023F8B2AA|nr:hypothetical protein [Lactobacillus sp. ESL0785]WEV70690.1 hypothetical protein OZY43_07055 [Lactobacillus sp. ESL0785]